MSNMPEDRRQCERSNQGLKLPKYSCFGRYGNTALHFAAINEKVDAVELLLRNKADAALTNEFNRNPFDEAVAKNNGRIRHMLMKYIEENQNANVEDLEKQ